MGPSLVVLALALGLQLPNGTPSNAAEREPLGRRCEAGDSAACRRLGGLLCDGPWRERDYFRALTLFDRACQLGDPTSCARQGLMLARRQGQAVASRDAVVALYQKACDGGDVHGCYLGGHKYLRVPTFGVLPVKQPPTGRRPDPGRAIAIFDQACGQGDAEACSWLAEMYDGREVTAPRRDAARAAEYQRKACDAGDAEGCAGLGLAYAAGHGVAKDEARASVLFAQALEARLKSCSAGQATDCSRLGSYHREGKLGAPRDSSRAITFYEKACDLGDADGCRDLAPMFHGTLDPSMRNLTRAQELGKRAAEVRERLCEAGDFDECRQAGSPLAQYRACDHGDPEACHRLGRTYEGNADDTPRAAHFYEKGCDLGAGGLCAIAADLYAEAKGLPRDLARAIGLYEKACSLDEARACVTLGDFSARGYGRPKDLGQAASFHEKACEKGSEVGCRKWGDALRDGIGITRDPARAAAAYAKACHKNLKEACYQHALLSSGTGVAPDKRPGMMDLMREACDDSRARGEALPQSCQDACVSGNAAVCALIGQRDRAEKLYERECDGDGFAGCHALAKLLVQGTLPQSARGRVATALDKACQGGVTKACLELGRFVVLDDGARALRSYERACDAADADGCRAASGLLTGEVKGVRADPERAEQLRQRARVLRGGKP